MKMSNHDITSDIEMIEAERLRQQDKKIFEAEIELRGSRAHWLVGAGFENPGERVVRMYAKKEGRYLELIEEGYSHMEAMDEVLMSSPRHRGDQTDAREGLTKPMDDLGD